MSRPNLHRTSPEAFTAIGAVERDTGLSKDTLRIWERRYGFPTPRRDANGERVYAQSQVRRLHLIKRLIDQGHRPGAIVPRNPSELEKLAQTQAPAGRTASEPHAQFMQTLKSHDVDEMQQFLNNHLMRQGLETFVIETVAGLNVTVGEAWSRGELAVHEEHLYAQQIENTLRHAIFLASHRAGAPRVLLTSVPGEQHRIGLLMVEALLSAAGASCIALGVQTPVGDIALAAAAHRVNIVALSFSSVFQPAAAQQSLRDLRGALASSVSIWAGGQGLQRVREVAGVRIVRDLASLKDALADWRASASDAGGAATSGTSSRVPRRQ